MMRNSLAPFTLLSSSGLTGGPTCLGWTWCVLPWRVDGPLRPGHDKEKEAIRNDGWGFA